MNPALARPLLVGEPRAGSLGQAIRPTLTSNWPLTAAAGVSLILLAVAVVGLIVDPRVITGVPAWIKPVKFAISVGVYTVTLGWLLTVIPGHRWLKAIAGGVTGVSLIVELALITLQVVRGTTSHFNLSTAFDAALFSTMGTLITIVALMALVVAVLLSRVRHLDPTFAWSLRLGTGLMIAGMFVAFLMTSMPSAAQRTAIQQGQRPTSFGAHSVGVEDGGAGLPLVGWSTEGGDLRVPHFVGLHALQVLPLLGLVVLRRGRSLSQRQQTRFVQIAGAAYFGLMLLLTWQALRGQSIVAPDGQTLLAFGGLVGATAVATLAVVRARPSSTQDADPASRLSGLQSTAR